jgi:uncharacterized protein YoxC
VDANVLNLIVVISLGIFAFSLFALIFALQSLVPQVAKTLGAYERLAGTLETELAPTLREVNKVVVGITELKTVAVKNVSDVSHKVEDVTGNLTKAADNAKRHSSVFGAGFLAAAKAYLEQGPKHADRNAGQNGTQLSEAKQIIANRGE